MQIDTCRTNDGAENWDEPATRVVEEVARAKNVDPLDLDLLSEVVDPDALNDLVSHAPREVRVAFEYERHTVTVRGDGHVRVE
ncbi:HalOD1 output domain-containing protein [Halosolutus halophilus]|uniref:HalOD1 output domain-containing protein n=1 Tax=Halosolutus halophilus TaxID=1552990 RepID=UPI002234F771|nr:HalOD1 output domain-containing protein [Halosolutus halophilus]